MISLDVDGDANFAHSYVLAAPEVYIVHDCHISVPQMLENAGATYPYEVRA
jgi:hypothetical protein